MTALTQKLKTLSQKPGVYLFKNAAGEVIYVGKAKNLKNRVKSYFQNKPEREPRLTLLIEQIADLDYVIVSSETESLILENNFIKQYQPRFNVRLRDDKNYQFIKIDYETQIPQIYPVRRVDKARLQNKYFGPFTSAASVRETLKMLKQVFRLCANKKVTDKPCFYYHLGRCAGVCFGKISVADYRAPFAEIESLLSHRQADIVKTLRAEMLNYAKRRQFEKATIVRDRLRALERIWEKQKIVSAKRVSQDIFSLYISGAKTIVNLFLVREGKLIYQETFELNQIPNTQKTEILTAFLKQYYADATDRPKEIVIPFAIPAKTEIVNWLGAKITVPARGKKIQLLKLGDENAQDYYQKTFASFESVLTDLQKTLKLKHYPNRIEAYDTSNIQGFLPVGSMVVFENGLPKKSAYRKFKINSKATPDDFAMMQEMLTRRFARAQSGDKSQNTNLQTSWPLPDLLVIDGGKGQLTAALSALRKTHPPNGGPNDKFQIIGLAKRLEEIFIPGRKSSLRLPADSKTLFLLERLRDEAHRFAITFYRGRHRKAQIQSRLDEIPGIGPKTRKKLLQKFGSVSALRLASFEAIASGFGVAIAKKIKELL